MTDSLTSVRRLPSAEPADRPRIGGVLRQILGATMSGPVLTLALRRWPSAAETAMFRAGVCDRSSPLPPLMRGLRRVPAAMPDLFRTVVDAGMFTGRVSGDPWPDDARLPSEGAMPHWDGPPIAFLHFEKTAGTSLMEVLRGLFHPQQIDPDPHRAMPPHLLAPFAPNAAARLHRYALIWGHYDLPSLRRLDARRFVLTLLREPGQRLLSLYAYWRAVNPEELEPDERHQGVLAARALTLPEFLRCDDPGVLDFTDNLYVRRLTGLYRTGRGRDPVAADPRAALEQAMAGLAGLDFVGIAEDMPASLARLGRLLDFSPPPVAPWLNATLRDHAVAPDIAAALERRVGLDRQVYDTVRRRFLSCRATAKGPRRGDSQ